MSQRSLLLKIFSGPHVGGEVLLRDGEHVIGSDESCDVILNDQFIAPRHAQLTIAGGRVEVASLETGKVFVDGRPIEQAEVEYFQYFTLGNTHLAIGPADAKWPVREFPEFRLDIPTEEPAEEEADAEAAAEKAEEQSGEQAEPPQKPSRRRLLLAVALVILFLLLNMGAGYAVIGGSWFARSEAADDGLLEAKLQEVIHEYAPHGGVTLSRWAKGFHVQGYVMSADERSQLEKALRELEPEISFRVWDTEQLAASVREVLSVLGLDDALQALPGAPGEVVVSGELEDLSPWRSAERRIRHDVPVLDVLTDDVAKYDPQAARVSPPKVAGTSPSRPAPAAKPAAAEPTASRPAKRTASAGKPVVPENQTAKDPPVVLPLQSIHIGQGRSITLQDGQRIFEGAMLENGYKVKSIDPDKVVLSRNGSERHIVLGEIGAE